MRVCLPNSLFCVKFILIAMFVPPQAAYENRFYQVEWKVNDTTISTHDLLLAGPDHSLFQPLALDQTSALDEAVQPMLDQPSSRRRRAAQAVQQAVRSRRNYNRYTRSVQEFQQSALVTGDDPEEELDSFITSLPINRTVFFECSTPDVGCIKARFTVANFKVLRNSPIMVSVNFTIDLGQLGKFHS